MGIKIRKKDGKQALERREKMIIALLILIMLLCAYMCIALAAIFNVMTKINEIVKALNTNVMSIWEKIS